MDDLAKKSASTNTTGSGEISLNSNGGATKIATTAQKENIATGTLADPVISGFGTWLGTILSIVAAFVAYKQAKAAKSIAARIGDEQKRSAIHATFVDLRTLENQLSPLWDSTLRRGVKVGSIVAEAKQVCHRALGGLSKKRDSEIRALLQSLESKLDEYLKDPVDRSPTLNADVRRELQDLTSMCKDEVDFFASEGSRG